MDAYVPFCAPFLTDLRDRGPFTHISDYYPKMSYVTYERWEPMIPQTGDKAEKFLDFILANDKTKYNGETQGEKRPFPLARRSWLRPVKQTKRDAQEKRRTPAVDVLLLFAFTLLSLGCCSQIGVQCTDNGLLRDLGVGLTV